MVWIIPPRPNNIFSPILPFRTRTLLRCVCITWDFDRSLPYV